jgi:hypothetical protein
LSADAASPLEIRTSHGWSARFCVTCVSLWWRIEFDSDAPAAETRGDPQ